MMTDKQCCIMGSLTLLFNTNPFKVLDGCLVITADNALEVKCYGGALSMC